jgi:hypothetical protein
MNSTPNMLELNPPNGTMDALLAHAPVDAARLTELLALEFEVLKARDMVGFEALQE